MIAEYLAADVATTQSISCAPRVPIDRKIAAEWTCALYSCWKQFDKILHAIDINGVSICGWAVALVFQDVNIAKPFHSLTLPCSMQLNLRHAL